MEQNVAFPKDHLYPLIEIVLMIIIRADSNERSQFRV